MNPPNVSSLFNTKQASINPPQNEDTGLASTSIAATNIVSTNTNSVAATPLQKATSHLSPQDRWRLLLGEVADTAFGIGDSGGSGTGMMTDERVTQMQKHLDWLYGREQPQENDSKQANEQLGQERLSRQGGTGPSVLSTPDWINNIESLFPKETVERLQKDALELYHLDDLVTNIEVLNRATANPTLLAAVLKTKHLMNPDVLQVAKRLVAEVVEQLMAVLAQEVRQCFSSKREPIRLKPYGSSRQLSLKDTLKRNIKHYDVQRRQLIISQPWFYDTEKKTHPKSWQMIILVDQSGSMVNSVIHSAITAACFWGIKNLKTHLIAFDSNVVDLTQDVQDPTELLMQVQLGGGTNIAKAVSYGSDLISVPKRAIMVVISDFFEGGNPDWLVLQVADLTTQGSRVLALPALDNHANPSYCKQTAARLMQAGAEVGAMTPLHLANWLAEVMA